MNDYGLTVVIPCHNDGDYIGAAVESVREQAGVDVEEVIIVDDRSEQRTRSILRALAHDGWVRVLENTGALGPAAARNVGWQCANSRWIAFLDADDVLLPGSLSRRVDALRQCGGLWVGGDFEIWWPNSEGGEGAEVFFARRPTPRRLLAAAFESGTAQLYSRPVSAFLETSLSHLCATVIARELVEAVGGFDERYRWVEDYHFFLRLARIADFVFVPDVLFRYRQHGASTTGRPVSWAPMDWHIKAFKELYSDGAFREYRPIIRRRLAWFHRGNSNHYRRAGRRHGAVTSAVAACSWEPACTDHWRSVLAAALGAVGRQAVDHESSVAGG